ncbi:MAG: hypothetical protein MUC95_06785 [Spirochaetes bacterium]|nr:hypothetical protein [Spirochaetota bacterium]
MAKKAYTHSVRESKKDLDTSRTYRFVRFLPEYAWVGWSAGKLKEPVTVYKKGKPLMSSNDTAVKSRVNIVSVGFYPDTINVQDAYRVREALGRAQ